MTWKLTDPIALVPFAPPPQQRCSGHPEAPMQGVITGRDVLRNSMLIWKEFGPRCLMRCLLACCTGAVGPKKTFLMIAFKK